MNEDFSNLNLFLSERFKLFVMRFTDVHESFLGGARNPLSASKLISCEYEFVDTNETPKSEPVYFLTDRYYRYCRWKRNRTTEKLVWSVLIPALVSALTALITTGSAR